MKMKTTMPPSIHLLDELPFRLSAAFEVVLSERCEGIKDRMSTNQTVLDLCLSGSICGE
jgi:hypothetical protein